MGNLMSRPLSGNIVTRSGFADSLWDWCQLNPVLPGKIRCSDIDGICEINGSFLVMEGKRTGQWLPTGQQILLKRLAALPDFTVLMIYGDPSTSTPDGFARMDAHGEMEYLESDGWEGIQTFVSLWASAAQNKKNRKN